MLVRRIWGKSASGKQRKCRRCGQLGHVAKTCERPAQQPPIVFKPRMCWSCLSVYVPTKAKGDLCQACDNHEMKKLRCRCRNHGLSKQQHDLILASQHHACYLCRRQFGGQIFEQIDHDHVTGNVRGLLCIGCNLMLGRIEMSEGWLERIVTYLHQPCVAA